MITETNTMSGKRFGQMVAQNSIVIETVVDHYLFNTPKRKLCRDRLCSAGHCRPTESSDFSWQFNISG